MTTNPRTILITGCSAHGIGAALALNLAHQGHFIFATARSPTKVPESLTSLANVKVLRLEVTHPASITDAVRALTEHGSGLDILVNNAGVAYTVPLLDADLDRAMDLYDTNVWGVLRLVQACSGLLVASKGRIVNISGAGAAVNTAWIGVYSSSKAAATQLSETLRLELAPFGVSVVCIMAGTVPSAFHANEPEVILPQTSREFAASIVDEILGIADGVVWKGPYSAMVRVLSRWCPAVLLDRIMSNGQGLEELTQHDGKSKGRGQS